MAGERLVFSIVRTTTGRSELSTAFSSLYLDGDKILKGFFRLPRGMLGLSLWKAGAATR